MAARRGKNQATRNSGHATPAWVWLVLGLLIGLAVYFIVPGLGKKDGDSFFRPQPNPDAQPAPIDSADVEAVVPDAPASDAPATTVAVNDLENRGLVERHPHPENRRAKLVSLTRAGRQVVELIHRTVRDDAPPGFQHLSRTDLAHLRRILERVGNSER